MTMTVLSCALASGPAVGCSSSAELTRDDGAVLVGRIVGADETRIWVNADKPRQRVVVERDRLIDIDHPGDAGIAWGSVVTGFGALCAVLAVTGLSHTPDERSGGGYTPAPEGAALLLGLTSAAALAFGIPLLVTGIGGKAASKAAASPSAGPPAPTLEVGLTGLRVTF